MVDSVASWANAITVTRILLSPLMFWAIPRDGSGSWIAFFLWFVLCASDGIDGYIARKRGPTSVGAFLDPLADKVLVLGAMFTLVSTGVNSSEIAARSSKIKSAAATLGSGMSTGRAACRGSRVGAPRRRSPRLRVRQTIDASFWFGEMV